jgi:AcrR family transcriptional regulator
MSSKESKTRTKILDATWKLMEKQRGRGVRMSDIAKKAGVSRQAVYLHFDSRVELMSATTKYVDEVLGLDGRFAQVQEAKNAGEALEFFIEVWGNYIPEIYGISKALLAVRDEDEAAAAAWDECMECLRSASNEIVGGLEGEGSLSASWDKEEAGELLFAMLSIQNWEQLTLGCGWTQAGYVEGMKLMLRRTLLG